MAFSSRTSRPKSPAIIAAFSPPIISTPSSSVRQPRPTSAWRKSPPVPPASSISSPAPASRARRMSCPMICPPSSGGPAASRNFLLPSALAFRFPAMSPFSAASPMPPSSAPPSSPKLKKRHPSLPQPLPLAIASARSKKPLAMASPAARSPHEPQRLALPHRRNRQETRPTLERALALRSRNRQAQTSGENSAVPAGQGKRSARKRREQQFGPADGRRNPPFVRTHH